MSERGELWVVVGRACRGTVVFRVAFDGDMIVCDQEEWQRGKKDEVARARYAVSALV